ncbi:MAG TPA: uroporphyrinogen-III C-methyltransferase [Thiobacillaceae bacterium]|nr:uroporphyrinogen-III C-methyltransferase [Thiobacillaceae bacterium]HNU64870.1 uroporphyrinogen-III C-methyltransferase [Thiobacillaceae bacterium]
MPEEDVIPQTTARSPARPGWIAPAAMVLALIAVLGTLALGWQGYTQMRSLEVQLARRIGEFDAASREARGAAKAANEALADLQSRLMAMETRAQEAQNQQLALTAMYQELADSADERVLADMEQTLLLARQQLQLAGNVRAALIGLEAADTRLAKLGKSQFAGLRQAIVRDMERLRLMPAADIDGINARLEALIQGVDQLKPESEAEPPPAAAVPGGSGTLDTLESFGRETWKEIKGLLRIRRLDHPELPLLTPAQSYFLNQNLKLRLLAARLTLLQRDEAGFRADLGAARSWAEHYFNRRDPTTQAFIASLNALSQVPVALKDAQIQASLEALQALRGGRP